jgi:aspartyl/glutamyl-tRNA(Asn/Gln) amidotransferase C subunit
MRYALVTGGSRGIGKAISVKLAKMGYYIIVNYNSNKTEAENTLSLISENSGKGEIMQFDVSDIEATAHAAPLHNVAREDELKSFDNREVIIENAPATIDDDLVKVPKVMQAEEESC